MSQTFRQLLLATSEQVERPRPLAPGHYVCFIKESEFGVSRQKKTPYVRFIFVPEMETEDVKQGANEGIDLAKKELRKEFYITPTALYRLSDFCDAVLGKQFGRSIDERIPDTRGVRVLAYVSATENQEGTESYNNVGTVVAYGVEAAAA